MSLRARQGVQGAGALQQVQGSEVRARQGVQGQGEGGKAGCVTEGGEGVSWTGEIMLSKRGVKKHSA